MMKKILLFAASLLVLNANAANACSCVPTTPQQSLKNSNAVFAGKVINIAHESSKNPEVSASWGEFKIRFEVSKVWKGKIEKQQVVLTSDSSAACGYSFEKGKEYLVYASDQESTIRTGLCSGTKPLANAQTDLAVLGRGNVPAPKVSNTAQLQQSKRLWAKQKIANYRYTLSRSCFCVPEARQPVKIEVRNGKVTSLVAANSGKAVNPEYFSKYDSIPKLFDIVQDAIAKKAHRISVTYHPTLGYPTKIEIDYDQQMADEELYVTVENLEVIK